MIFTTNFIQMQCLKSCLYKISSELISYLPMYVERMNIEVSKCTCMIYEHFRCVKCMLIFLLLFNNILQVGYIDISVVVCI